MSDIRLDKYLWAVRIFKTRSDAADAIRQNRVMVNDAYAKPSREVKVGDMVSVRRERVTYSYKVLDLVSSRPLRTYLSTASTAHLRRSWTNSTCLTKPSSSSATVVQDAQQRRSAEILMPLWRASTSATRHSMTTTNREQTYKR